MKGGNFELETMLMMHSPAPDLNCFRSGRYKVQKELSPAKRCEKSGKYAKRAMFHGSKTDSAISCI